MSANNHYKSLFNKSITPSNILLPPIELHGKLKHPEDYEFPEQIKNSNDFQNYDNENANNENSDNHENQENAESHDNSENFENSDNFGSVDKNGNYINSPNYENHMNYKNYINLKKEKMENMENIENIDSDYQIKQKKSVYEAFYPENYGNHQNNFLSTNQKITMINSNKENTYSKILRILKSLEYQNDQILLEEDLNYLLVLISRDLKIDLQEMKEYILEKINREFPTTSQFISIVDNYLTQLQHRSKVQSNLSSNDVPLQELMEPIEQVNQMEPEIYAIPQERVEIEEEKAIQNNLTFNPTIHKLENLQMKTISNQNKLDLASIFVENWNIIT